MLESHTVLELKRAIARLTAVSLPPERQRLTCDRLLLKTHRTLASYRLQDGAIVHVHEASNLIEVPNENDYEC